MKVVDEGEAQKTTTRKNKQRQKRARGNKSYRERVRNK